MRIQREIRRWLSEDETSFIDKIKKAIIIIYKLHRVLSSASQTVFFFCILTVAYEFYGVIHHMLKWGNHCFQKIKISKSNKQYRCRRNRIENWVEDHSIVGKESTWNAGDPSLIPGSGRSPEERIIYPLKYSWASLVSQLETNLTATWETWFDPWVVKIPWRRERLPTPVNWPGEFHGLYSPWGHQ